MYVQGNLRQVRPTTVPSLTCCKAIHSTGHPDSSHATQQEQQRKLKPYNTHIAQLPARNKSCTAAQLLKESGLDAEAMSKYKRLAVTIAGELTMPAQVGDHLSWCQPPQGCHKELPD
jgi:hypothetical protein